MEYTSFILEYLHSYGLGLLLVHGGDKLLEGTEDVVSADEDVGMGRIKHAGVGDLFQGGGTGGSYLWFGYVGDDPCMRRDLGRLHNRVSKRIMVRQLQRRLDGRWEYPLFVEAMWEVGLEEAEPYLLRRKNTAAQYIVTRPILELCEEAVQRYGTWV